VGVDIGGTFTDIVVVKGEGETITKKVSSSVDDYGRAIVEGLDEVFSAAGMDMARISEFLHGTTVASNTILEMAGARAGLITTKGFRDVLEIRNLRMPKLYDLTWDKPAPLVERYLRLTVDERIDADGNVETPLDRADVERTVDRLLAEDVEGIAVCLINSYANPSHERLIAEVIEERAPGLPYCISCDILPEIKEYERTSTTVVNTYLMPVVSSYLDNLAHSLEEKGVSAPVLLMQSNGALTPLAEASRRPVNIVESGPAAGVVGAVYKAVESGYDDVISFDMGGTTAKASLAEDGEFTLSQEYSVGGGIMVASRLLTGGGYLLKVPAIDVAEVGAGGGSVVWIDPGGSIQIGPESAGAFPGPLCYDIGGDRPTVTDANVILGYLNPDYLVSGELKLNAERARQEFKKQVADRLGMDLTTAAFSARQIAISNMIRAIRAVSSERGRDPRKFALFALGGNGALHAAGMAHELGIRKIIVPPSAGVFSAYGLLYADIGHYYQKTIRALLSDVDKESLARHWRELEETALRQLQQDGLRRDEMAIEHFAKLRYRGQVYEITIPVDDVLLSADSPMAMGEAFSQEHERTYGHRAVDNDGVQLISLQVLGRGDRQSVLKPSQALPHEGDSRVRPETRDAYFGPEHGWLSTPVVARASLKTPKAGPCIVEEYDTTCLVPPNGSASLDGFGNIVIDLG
jgi:N-methylhydantoinase A